jgi:Uricase
MYIRTTSNHRACNSLRPFFHSSTTLDTSLMSEFNLSAARYGKDKVRVFRVIRPSTPGGQHQVVEYNVCLLLEGDIETRYASFLEYSSPAGLSTAYIPPIAQPFWTNTINDTGDSYTQADNSCVVATDSSTSISIFPLNTLKD